MCAERRTNSFLRAGSEPESLATMLADSTALVRMTALALSEVARAKCGRALRSLPRAAISAKVWPEPAKGCSAAAGVKARAKWRRGGVLDFAHAEVVAG